MSTRSRVGLLLENGSVISAYHHWDGYPEALGAKLVKDFDTKDKVAELIDGGDISSCMATRTWEGVPCEEEFVLYYSERGDQDVEPSLSPTLGDFICLTKENWGEYAYVFDVGVDRWFCYNMHDSQEINLYAREVAV